MINLPDESYTRRIFDKRTEQTIGCGATGEEVVHMAYGPIEVGGNYSSPIGVGGS